MSSIQFPVLLILLYFCPAGVPASSLSGKVADQAGMPVAGLRLQLSDQSRVRNTATDQAGNYRFDQLEPGRYLLSVRELGFEEHQEEIAVTGIARVEKDITVQLAALREQVIVTATRNGVSASLLGNSVTVLSEAEIQERNALSVNELLRSVPGVHVLQAGTPGSITSIYVRGGESDYNKVLVDGIPLNQPGGYVDFSNMTTGNVERIEVVRGPQSALYGSDAIASVIQIFSKRPEIETGRPQLELKLEGGNYSHFSSTGGLHGKHGKISYTGLFSHWETDGPVSNSFLNTNTLGSTVGVEISPRASLSLTGRAERGRSGVPGPTLFGPSDLEEYSQRNDLAVGAIYSLRLSDSMTQRVSFSRSQIHHLSEDPIDSGMFLPGYQGRQAPYPSFDFPYSYLNSTRRHTAGYQFDGLAGSHAVTTGIEYDEEKGVIGEVRASRSNFGYYLQDHFLLGQRLAMTAGMRLDKNGSFGLAATPRLSLSWLLRRGRSDGFWGMTRPKLNLGLGIKEPNLIESFSANPYFRGNQDLRPERTRSLEAGLDQRLASNQVRLELNGFYSYFLNQIDLLTTDFDMYHGSYFNIGRSQAWGIEKSVEFRPESSLRVSAGYTFLNSRILESAAPSHPVLQAGSRLLRRPTHSGTLSAGWFGQKGTVGTTLYVIGDRADSDFYGLGLREVEGYSRVDLRGSLRLHHRMQLYAVVQNLFDSNYSEALGYPALGVNFRSGLRFVF
jgi:vitamin B12 transporter